MKIIAILLLLLGASARAQRADSDWSRVEQLPQGTRLLVTTWRTVPCTLSYAFPEGMECLFRGGVYWIDRTRIERVSLERQSRTVAVATALGAAAGGSLAAAKSDDSDPQEHVRVLVGVAVGGCLGYFVGHLARPSEGQLVYIRDLSVP